MPPVIAAIGAVVGAISGAVVAIGTGLGLSAALAGGIASIVTGLIITTGISLISKLILGSTGPPPARGSVTQINIASDAPQPYVMGEGLVGGVLRHDTAYGTTLKDVPNPYRWMAVVYSGGGPIDTITAYVDQAAISGSYYTGFLYNTTQLGAQPESAALVPQFSGTPGWTTSSKLSGQAAIGWSLKFDRGGKVFASGIPQLGAYGKWVKVYDPRLDSTFPGGSGAHRLGTESTYAWSENPALHAGMYAYGRYQNGKRTIGCGLPAAAIDWANIAAWANVCGSNGWRLFGIVYEPDDRWRNIKDIAAAGGGVPVISGGVLSFHYQAPRTSMATITEADIADDAMSVTAMRSYRSRINTISPKYRDPASHWELVNAVDVIVSSYVTADGEIKKVEWPFNFVKDVNQAAQLARYVIEDSRELQPIEIVVGPHLRALRPGEAVDLNLPQIGLSTQAVILRREFDPQKMTVKLTLIGETTAKHASALGMTGTAPPTPALAMTGASRDDITYGADRVAIEPNADVTSSIIGLDVVIDADYTGAITTGLPKTQNYKMLRNGTDVTTSAAWSVAVLSGTIAATIGASTGTLSLDKSGGVLTTSTLRLTAVYGGTTRTFDVKVTRVDAAAPSGGSGGGTSANGNTNGSTSTTTMVAVGSVLTVTAGSGGTVTLSASYSFDVTRPDAAVYDEEVQWYLDISGTYTAQGSAVESIDGYDGINLITGYGDCNYVKTGLTAATSYNFRLYMANASGTKTRTITGTCSAVGS